MRKRLALPLAIKTIREAKGLSGSKVASDAGMAHCTLLNIESTHRIATDEAIVRIAAALGVPVDAISYPVATREQGRGMKVRHYIYRAYAADGRLLYIGQTIRPEQRFKRHSYTSPWFSEVHEWDVTEVGDWWQMQAAEREAIETEHPIHNVMWNTPKEKSA